MNDTSYTINPDEPGESPEEALTFLLNRADKQADCGHPATPSGHAPGWAKDRTGKTYCYPCADALHRAELETASDIGGYVSSDGKTITTWTGGELMRVTSESQGTERPWASLAQRLSYYQAVDANGTRWYGKGSGRGISIRMRRAKKA